MLVLELHLALGGVDVDIDLRRRQRKSEDGHRVLPLWQKAVICLRHRPAEEPTAHPASIDEETHVAATGATYRRRAYHPGYADLCLTTPPPTLKHLQHMPGDFRAIHLDDAVDESTFPRCAQRLSALKEKGEADLGIGEGVLADHTGDVAVLGGYRFEEFTSRRYIAKKVSHYYRRPLGSGLALPSRHLPLLNADAGACRLAGSAGQDIHLRHGGDAGQGLPPKSEGGNRLQIGEVDYLARGVALKCQRHFSRRYAGAVVHDPDEAGAAAPHLDGYLSRPGVQSVFHQLLHRRGRPLHHLAGSDLGDDVFIQDFYGHLLL